MTRQQKRLTLVVAIIAIAGLAAALVLTALRSTVSYFYTPTDLARAEQAPTGVIRLGGLVADGSVKHGETNDAEIRFVVADEFAETPVRFVGVLPDLFREGQGVVVQGKLVNGELEAMEVLAKHDETYMPKEVADALKEQGRWKNEGGGY